MPQRAACTTSRWCRRRRELLTLQLPEEIESQLEELATASGRTKASFAEEAIIEYLGDRIDVSIAENRLQELREGRSSTIPLDDLIKKYGLDDRDRCVRRAGPKPTRTRACAKDLEVPSRAIGERDDPRELGEALKGARLGQLWKYRVGDDRIIADIQDDVVRVLVVRVGHRRNVYVR